MLPDRKNQEVEVATEEEDELVADRMFAHPTRDDWHEQRERGQTYEAVVHAHTRFVAVRVTQRRRAQRKLSGAR
jgi:hypothetical protein